MNLTSDYGDVGTRLSSEGSDTPCLLIVEDDDEIASMLVELANENGFGAVPVGNGAAMDKALARRR
ncbi:MAG TPA: hypothetical protein PKE16_12945, partial [Hyphomicrobium sp.]|nr:hypothetical protein [Hyphomicrobium sp.]